MRELAGELRDEGDEGAGRRAREKKKIEEERRKKRSRRERENRKCLFNKRRERSVIKKNIFFLPLSYNAHLKLDVHYSCGAKIFRFSSTAAAWFFLIES